MKFEFPLQWPQSQPRTKYPERSRFGNISVSMAGDELLAELERLGADNLIISTNLQTRMRGDGFYTNQKVDDVGIAIYFQLKGDPKVMACDKWDKVEHNIWALKRSIEAIRGLERWGGSEFLDGLFTGFAALPAAGESIQTTTTYYFQGITDKDDLKKEYRNLARKLHPDFGGDVEEFKAMKAQYESLTKTLAH